MNQNPEQIARDNIDRQLIACGWIIQDKNRINLNSNIGIAVKEYLTDSGPADYVLFVEGKPCGIIEAKREEEGHRLTFHEDQTEQYAESKLKHLNNDPLPYTYQSTGLITRFTDFNDPKPRSREVFSFHRPETFREWMKEGSSLRGRLQNLPSLPNTGLRDCQIIAINNLESSFKNNRPKALIQMATGSGKTFTAITEIYRLLKFAKAKRILFLVDTKNLGEQAEQEFQNYVPVDDNRKFIELYNVQRLSSGFVPSDNQVYISTIQRLYSILKGTELEDSAEEENPNETKWRPKEIPPVEYNNKIPIEFFDFIVIDECHRSIFNLWKQVLDYFDAFEIGLTATPDSRTVAYFRQNLVSEYSHEMAVADGVNVGFDVFIIDTKISKKGGTLWKGAYVEHRERLSRKKRLELQDEDEEYSSKQLDKDIVNPNQIKTVINSFKENLPSIFPDRIDKEGNFEVPKTLIFAKTDSHAEDIIQAVRDAFDEENRFCKKITYKTEEDPKSVLANFRNSYYPRIAVTVDMIATGTDVKPLECLVFMRDVKSRNYFEQMKGRGTRTIDLDNLKKVSPSAKVTKDHFVIVDAIGVTKSLKTDSRPLEKKPGIPMKDLLMAVTVGNREEELFTTLAGRLTRLDKQITKSEKEKFESLSDGRSVSAVVKDLLNAYDPDRLEELRSEIHNADVNSSDSDKEEKFNEMHSEILNDAAKIFNGELNEYIENVRRLHVQKIDLQNPDEVITAGFDKENKKRAETIITDFKDWLKKNKDELTALQIFYDQPYRRRELTYAMINEIVTKLKAEKPSLAPLNIWRCYEQLDKVSGQPKNEFTALVSLIRNEAGIDESLTDFSKTVDRNFQQWILKKNAGRHNLFTAEQIQWLRMIKEHIATSYNIDKDDFDLSPFNAHGGLGRMWHLFGEDTEKIIGEMNEELAA